MLNNPISKKKILFILTLVVLIIITIFISLNQPKKLPPTQKTEVIPVQIKQISPLQLSTIGKTTQDQIERLPSQQNKETLKNSDIQYSFPSLIEQRPNQIIIHNNLAVFERIAVPGNPQEKGYAKISEFSKEYGEEDQIIDGSQFFGPFTSTYIYSSKGFAILGNPNTDEVYEIQVFLPTTVEDYSKTYGDDLKPSQPGPENLYP